MKRKYGTGSLFVRIDVRGNEVWYGQWRVDGHKVKRRIGEVRSDTISKGLTRMQAEERLAALMGRPMPVVPKTNRKATCDTAYTALRRAIDETDRAMRTATSRGERACLREALEGFHRAEDALVAARQEIE